MIILKFEWQLNNEKGKCFCFYYFKFETDDCSLLVKNSKFDDDGGGNNFTVVMTVTSLVDDDDDDDDGDDEGDQDEKLANDD